jgi:hypothetical protein
VNHIKSTPSFTLDTTSRGEKLQATRMYHEIAIKNGLTLELSLAFIVALASFHIIGALKEG